MLIGIDVGPWPDPNVAFDSIFKSDIVSSYTVGMKV